MTTKKTIKAFRERVLVKIVSIEKKKGILIVPDEQKDFQIGEVMAVGKQVVKDYKDEIKVGDYVYTRKFAGLLLEYDSEEYVSLKLDEILAVSGVLK